MLDFQTFDRIDRAAGGFDTTVWHLEKAGRGYALRVFRPDQMATLQREILALGAARRQGVPVPAIHLVGTYQARPALLMEWSRGRPLLDEIRARPSRVLQLGVQFGRCQAAIHRVAAPPALRANWIAWAGPLEHRFARHLERVSAGQPRRLLHLDYHPLNVLVHHQRVSSVLDWTNAHAGDPRADFARTVTILRLSPPRPGGLERLARLALEIGWRFGYGRLPTPMAEFYAWAGLAMQRDLAARFSPAELAHVQRWTAGWQRRFSP